jgi:DNA-binding NarL/FixJ family response regulator
MRVVRGSTVSRDKRRPGVITTLSSSGGLMGDVQPERRSFRLVLGVHVRVYREGLARVLGEDEQLDIVGDASDWDELIAIAGEVRPDVVVLDIPAENPAMQLRRLRAVVSDANIVALGPAEHDLPPRGRGGLSLYLARDASPEDLLRSVKRSSGTHEGPAARAGVTGSVRPLRSVLEGCLTSREVEILRLIDEGLSNKAIASRLVIEVPTVKNHVHRILHKLHVQRRVEAVVRARDLGFLVVPQPRARRAWQ